MNEPTLGGPPFSNFSKAIHKGLQQSFRLYYKSLLTLIYLVSLPTFVVILLIK